MHSLGANPAAIDGQVLAAVDRRRHVRHKTQLPAYATLHDDTASAALDLSEILNLSEDGMAIQTSSALEIDQQTTFFLDLPETHALIRAEGKVVWAGSSGRAGIQFAAMPEELNQALKKWLLANALAGWENQEPEIVTEIPADETLADAEHAALVAEPEAPVRPDYTSILSAVAAVKKEVEALGTDLDAALFLLARRTQTFTHASGAAIALTEGEHMVCRANAGLDAPPLGARLQIGSGFSGECVRGGMLLRCDDSETDSRVDRESCRALGIRSMIATPIRRDGAIIGLLEGLSPEAKAFGPDHEFLLPRLADLVADAVHRAGSPPQELPAKLANLDDEFPVEDPIELSLSESSRSRNVLLIATAITILFVVLWLIGTWSAERPRHAAASAPEAPKAAAPAPSENAQATADFPALRRLAERGDATAQFSVGARYATGEDVPQDYNEAVRWFTMAAEQGHVSAQATLGAYYWAGRGVAVDLNRAYFWSFLAEAGGDEASRSRVALLASRLTHGQIVAIQQQANEWFRQHQLAKSSPDGE